MKCTFVCLSYFRSLEDFGDGGAYPEIHVAQYPMNLGRPEHERNKKSKALAVQLDAEGKVKYDVLARQGHGKDKIVYRYLIIISIIKHKKIGWILFFS